MKRRWKIALLTPLALLAVAGGLLAWFLLPVATRIDRVEADPAAGFHWPYYLYVPEHVEQLAKITPRPACLLVLPNNTGRPDDDFEVHRRAAWMRIVQKSTLADELDVIALVPVFPRPGSDWRVYTHALDRDCLTTDVAGLERLDLQLIAMIDDARERVHEKVGMLASKQVLLHGFSANGMFCDRFTALHPERVLGVAAGSPGGWPIAPVAEWEGRRLRYPVGIADLEELTGRPFDAEAYARVPKLVYMGDEDTNDSVPYGDGYDDEDRELVYELFGEAPIDRWETSAAIRGEHGGESTFVLEPGVGHETSPEMAERLREFLGESMGRLPHLQVYF